ncbi:MAG: hypothetical protein JRD89_17120 [Deltaproteobacteria bacterium]|nr:hypothetical protein [Deltaproteobacteria bacterium]
MFTKGQIKMELASQLTPTIGAAAAFDAAMRIVDAGQTPKDLREKWGDEVADAIDADLKDMN